MELTTRPQSGFNWPDTDEKKKSNEFDWPEVDPTRPEPELQTFTYQDRLNAAKEGRTIGANTEPESVDGLRLEFITGFEKREGDALMKGETMRNLSRDEVLNYIEAKEAQGFDYGRMMGGIAPAMGTVLDELTRGVFVRGSLDFASGASAPLIEGFHKNLGKESPMNRELRMALGNIQRGNPDRTSMRLAMRMPQGQGVTGGTLEERAQEYLTKAHVTNGQLMASLLGKKVKDLGYDKLPQWMTGGQRGEQEITEEMFGPIAESVGRAAWSEFVDSVPESDRKHLKKLGYDSIFDGFDRPKTISTTAQAKVAASTLANFPARILASMGEGVAQAGHGTAMIGHMAVANWDGGLAKLDQSVNNYLANEALRYRKANNLPIPKKGDELLTGLPEDVVAGWKDKIKPLIEKRRDRIVESWMTKHQYMAEMERARLGKEPILSQAFRDAGNEGAAKALDNLVNKDLALGLAYAGDAPATLAVGAVRQGLTKGAVRSVAGRGVASKAAEGTGKVLKGVDEKIIAPFERAPQAIIDYTESAIGVPLPRKIVNAVDLASIPLLVARTPGAAGEVLEAVGRATSSGQTLQGTAAKIFNDPKAAPWVRNIAGKLQIADPFFEYGYNITRGLGQGSFAGGAITLATGDEDMIAGGIGSGAVTGLVFAVPASMGGVKRQIKAKNTIDEWLGLKEQEAATAEKAGLTEQAQVLKDNVYILKNLPLETQLRAAELELIVKGFGGNAGKGDIPVEYIFSDEKNYAGYYDRDSQKVIVNLAKAEINDGASLAHEVMHALEHVDNDAMGTTLANINSVMFGDGGIYSMDVQRDRGNQYLGRFWEGIDAQRDKLLKMDPKDPDYAAAYEQYQSAKDSLNAELDKMGLAPDTREVTAEGFDANAKFQSIVRSEIRAEDFSSMYRSQDPGALLEGPSLVANVKRQVILAKSYSTFGKLRYALEKIFKVQFGEDGAPSPLFKNEKGEWATSNPMVNQLLKDYVTLRKNIGEQAEILAKAENNEVMVPTSEEMASNPLLMEMFKGDDHVVKDPTTGEPKLTPDGRPVILSSREVRKLQRERIKAIDEALQLVDDSGGLQRQADERTGKVRWGGGEEGWTAPIMNDVQVEAIMALPDNVIPANKKEQIKIFHEAMKAGKTVEVFYRGITGATAKRAGWRQDSPFGVEITLDGNVNFRTINLNRLQDNIDRWTNKRNRKTKLDLWDENVSDFKRDFATYRENHRNGRPGHFGLHPDEAIALARKERLNELVGVSGSEKARSVSIEGPRRRRAESTRSWQGILKIQPGDPDYTLSYPKLRRNLMPAGNGGDIFYSNTSKALESPRVRNSATGQAMLNDILRQDPAAGQEMKWIGLLQWLKDKKGKVTKEELQDYIDTNQIAVVEKIRGGDESPEIRAAEEAVEDAKRNMWDADDRGTYQEAREAEAAYREAVNELDFLKKDLNILKLDDQHRALPGAKEGSYRELELMFPKRKGEQFTESHFETDENVFAHVRFNERIDADGKRMLFIEELQSDWWNKGRQLGFDKPYINGDIVGGREESIPPAPFVSKQKGDQYVNDDKWRALAFKRMLRWGADNGYDRVGWITGRDSAARYKLNTYVSKIEYMRLPGENQTMISAWDKAGSNVMSAKMIPNKDLVQTVGKDLAQKIDSDKSGMGEFDGLDLAMGGKFHKVFYDIDLPNYVNKYIKTNWGGEVGMVEVSDTKAHYVDITPEMKADVQQGQAMFMPAGSDAAYMKAAEKGDIKGAQLLVDKAAKAAGDGPNAVYHGTTHKFNVFKNDRGNAENDFGVGHYFTTSQDDVSANYAGLGPDLTSRIELRAEALEDEGLGRDAAFSAARSELAGGEARVITAYVKTDNPAVFGKDDRGSEMRFESLSIYDEAAIADKMPELRQEIAKEEGVKPNEVEEFEVRQRAEEWADDNGFYNEDPHPLLEAVERVSSDLYDVEGIDRLQEILSEEPTYAQVEDVLRREVFQYATNDTGGLVTGDSVKRVFQELGHDGIIDRRVNEKFGTAREVGVPMEGMREGDTHVIVFDPNQIKSADPITRDDAGNIIPLSERFNPSSDDIRYMPAGGEVTVYRGTTSGRKVSDRHGGFHFAAMDKKQAEAYALGDSNGVRQEKINLDKILSEEEARNVMREIGIAPKDYEFSALVDKQYASSAFLDSFIGKANLEKFRDELIKRGKLGVRFADFDATDAGSKRPTKESLFLLNTRN